MDFTISGLHWRDTKKKKYQDCIKILNNLTEEQKEAVDLFGQSKYNEGSEDGYESGYHENCE